jgi:hypothetical protein
MHISHPHDHVLLNTCKGMGNCPSLDIILLHTYNLGNVVFTWSILSWLMHRNSSINHTDFILQIWWVSTWFLVQICFLIFASYSKPSLLFFPNLDIKSFGYSQIVHSTNTNPYFHTSTLRWCLFLNLFIANWKIPPMFNSLFICQPTNTRTKKY